jgi:hypothetical protein
LVLSLSHPFPGQDENSKHKPLFVDGSQASFQKAGEILSKWLVSLFI